MKPQKLIISALACVLSLPLATSQLAAREKKVPIGAQPENLTFTDIRYLPRTLDDFGKPKAYVLAFTTTGCPLVERYLPRLNELYKKYGSQGVQFIAVNVSPDDSIKEIAYQAMERGVEFPFVKDMNGDSARALGADRTPQVVVLDASRKIRYRGRIDDQYRLGGIKPTIGREDLKAAIDDVLAGRKVKVKETIVDGCVITFPEKRAPNRSLTYAKDVAPLLNKYCVDCHHPGTAAPFALTTYEKAAAKAGTIAEVVEERRMPPWFAHPGFGKFMNQRVLTTPERETIVQWARGDKAPGDLSKAPKPPEFPDTKWLIGEPDLIVTAAKPEKLPATGYINYRYVILPYVFPYDTWVQGVQIMPSNPKVVHHANIAFASLGGFDEDHNFITGKVPGGIPVNLDSGRAIMIPKGVSLVYQIHYVTTGKEETDQISVGLRFAKEPIHKRVRYKIIGDYKFKIPPGDSAYPVSAQKELECDATGIALFSHMHLRGKDSTFFAHYPDGKSETLLVLPNYSFDWQLSYVWEPGARHFPKGTKIECASHFDNSTFNPYNPNPGITVTNGPQTHDEMMQGFFFYTDDHENLNLRVDPKTGKEIAQETRASAN